ncbi:hypothetical protein [Luteibacter sp. 3190]|uniref:hypothetical protein n=1 Tax=Luteibacter sp. 3190 TaxID=2817736 RepID=UPI0028564CE6|nr:hypothetical protein [Luteibacter sp. 3190]MDR6935350.1 hypothetical protein [Luteibacter sp. 3190]
MRASTLLIAVLTLGIAACSPSPPQASHSAEGAASGATSDSAATPSAAASAVVPATTPAAGPSEPSITAAEKPFEKYTTMGNDPLPWLGQFYAASGVAVDYAAVAQRLDPTYQASHDAFAQRDALAAFKTKLDHAIAEAKANPYIRLPAYQAKLPAYDLDHGRYDLSSILGTDTVLTVADNAAEVGFTASGALASYAPKDEAEARATEKTLGGEPLPRAVHATVFGKVVGGALNRGMPQLQVIPARVVLTTVPLGGPAQPVLTATVP